MKKLYLLPEAYFDISKAEDYYNEQRQGLGEAFLFAIQDAFHDISSHPNQFQKIYKQDRKCNVHRFPYGIIYKVRKDDVAIKAIVHLKRHPRIWRNRKD